MSNLFITIVPNLQLKNGQHTIRIAVTHAGQTRYIPTAVVIDSEKEIKNDRIVKRPDSYMLNAKLSKELRKYEERCQKIEYIDCLSCSQLVKLLKSPIVGEQCRKVEEVVEEYLSQIDETEREKSHRLYRLATNRFLQFTGPGSLMEHITPLRINQYINHLVKSKLSNTTINIYITLLKVVINYAVKMRYVNYDVDPFVTAKIPSAKKRETQITVDELKAIRDSDLSYYNLNVASHCQSLGSTLLFSIKGNSDELHKLALYHIKT